MKQVPLVQLRDCAGIVSGSTPRTSETAYWNGDICWATPKDLSELQGAYISDTPRKITRSGLDSCAATLLPSESVLFSSRAPIGHVAINTIPMATNQGFKSFVPDRARLDPKYLYYWLRANRPYFESLGNGATFKEVSKAIVSRVEIPLPELPEQRRIAAILDQADALRAKRRAAIAKLDTLAQAIFLGMFGDPAGNPKNWPVRRVEQLLAIPLRNGMSPSRSGKLIREVLTLSAITGGEFDPRAFKRGTFDSSPPDDATVVEGDFLICRGNGNIRLVGKGHFPTVRMGGVVFPDTMIAARFDSSVNHRFLEHVWNTMGVRRQLESGARTTNGTFKINQTILERISLWCPPSSLQQEFAQRIRSLKKVRETHLHAVSEADALFASLQARAFRGEL